MRCFSGPLVAEVFTLYDIIATCVDDSDWSMFVFELSSVTTIYTL